MLTLIAVLGPPGSGKGTQCRRLSQMLGFAHLSVGQVLRDEIDAHSAVGDAARTYVDAGELAPDEVVASLIATHLDRLERDGTSSVAFLDGFPRTVGQAEALSAARPGSLRLAVHLAVDEPTARRRLARRARRDDDAVTLRRRLEAHAAGTDELLPWLETHTTLVQVDGDQTPDAVTAATLAELLGVTAPQR
jgi:adenylate kinase